MKFLFLGAGAIGTYVGGALAAAGHDVTFIEQPSTAEHISRVGLSLTRHGVTTKVNGFSVYPSATEALAAGDYDIGVFAVKSFDTEKAAQELRETSHEVPTILSLQNGVDNESVITSILGEGMVIAGTVATAVSKSGIGQVIEEKHRGLGITQGHSLAKSLVNALNDAELSAKPYNSAPSMKWSKLLTNLTGNATSAILDLPVETLFADDRLYRIEVQVLRECLAVMHALGYRVVDLPGTPIRALAFAVKLPQLIAQPLLTKFLGSGRGDKMPSFHIDLHGGAGRTEVRWLNGAVSRYGAEVGVATPVNDVLTSTLEDLSSGKADLEHFRKNPDALLALLA